MAKKVTKTPIKRFIVRKYVFATSAGEALKKEHKLSADDIWVDDQWMKENQQAESALIGFKRHGRER